LVIQHYSLKLSHHVCQCCIRVITAISFLYIYYLCSHLEDNYQAWSLDWLPDYDRSILFLLFEPTKFWINRRLDFHLSHVCDSLLWLVKQISHTILSLRIRRHLTTFPGELTYLLKALWFLSILALFKGLEQFLLACPVLEKFQPILSHYHLQPRSHFQTICLHATYHLKQALKPWFLNVTEFYQYLAIWLIFQSSSSDIHFIK